MANEVQTFNQYLRSFIIGRHASEQVQNARPHFVPLNEDAMRKTLTSKVSGVYNMTPANFTKFYAELLLEVSSKWGTKRKIISRHGRLYIGDAQVTNSNIFSCTPALVYGANGRLMGALFAAKDSFTSTRVSLFSDILNAKLVKYLNTKAYDRSGTKIKAGFDVGHLASLTDIATSHVWGQIDKLVVAANESLANNEIPEDRQAAATAIVTELNNTAHKFISQHTYADEVINTLTRIDKDFSSSMLSVNANIVIVQNAIENRYHFGVTEGKLLSDIKNILKKIHFSNNMEEEAVARIEATLLGKKLGRTKASKSIKDTILIKDKLSIEAASLRANQVAPLVNPSTNRKLGPSLASLQLIINQHLPHVIAANMGDQPQPGGQRAVLNYRTGRFANSAEVERLTMSKEGMVTAFYSYMKNPYATFSEGGMQYKPSRDPKKLIGEAIRDIARQYVGNRMRAVVV